MADRLLPIPEVIVPGQRLGRSVAHDARSLQYKVPRATTPKSVKWERRIPIHDQNTAGPGGIGLGTCTCNTGLGILGTDPFYDTLPKDVQSQLTDRHAVDLYREVTRIDPFPGQYEPDDTGSAELFVGKILKARGWISGYQTATNIDEAHAAIQRGPYGFGSIWFSGMDTPNQYGQVFATGFSRGGHEYIFTEYDAAQDRWWFDNSWTEFWGKGGRAWMDTPTKLRLMGMQGDIVSFVPLTAPAPQPTPQPDPGTVVEPDEDFFADFPKLQVKPWLSARVQYTQRERTAKSALAGWLAAKGYDL